MINKKKIGEWLIVIAAFGLVFAFFMWEWGLYRENGGPLVQIGSQNYTTNSVENIYLSCKDEGDCRTLTGDVLITVIFVDDSDSTWTTQDIEVFKRKQNEEINKLISEADEYGVYLNIKSNYLYSSIWGSVSLDESLLWANRALKASGLPKGSKSIEQLKNTYNVKEAPIIFAVNRPGRAFALNDFQARGFEYAVVYNTAEGFAHELCHMFGAMDYYMPETIKALAENYFPNSLMLDGVNGSEIDNLTAYVIGWETALSEDSNSFVNQTNWIDVNYWNSIAKENTKTGYGTYEWDGGTYTGDLVDGVPYGNGKMVWDNGTIFVGEVVNGEPSKGTYTYSDGTQNTIG